MNLIRQGGREECTIRQHLNMKRMCKIKWQIKSRAPKLHVAYFTATIWLCPATNPKQQRVLYISWCACVLVCVVIPPVFWTTVYNLRHMWVHHSGPHKNIFPPSTFGARFHFITRRVRYVFPFPRQQGQLVKFVSPHSLLLRDKM